MKIAVLYICTGKYSVFWKNFYQSAQQYFLPECEKHYFVFTDNSKIFDTNNIHVKYESPKGFPLDSLLRFDMFLSIKEALLEMDYIYFFNSNMQFVNIIGKEILPIQIDFGLVALIHPGYYNKKMEQYPYERNLKSTAYIKYNNSEKYYYFMGSLNGGKAEDYLKLIEECSKNVKIDMKNDTMAIYHDESHLNQYLHKKKVVMLSPEYGFPEGSKIPFDPKIIILNKIKHGGIYFDKLPKKAYFLRFNFKIKRIIESIIWKYF